MSAPRVVVVGAGIAGLSTAFRLREALRRSEHGGDVVVLEAGPRAGGNIRTERADRFTLEWGPNGFLDNVPATLALVRDLGLEDRLQSADPLASVRYIWRHGTLHPLPKGPLSFLRSGVLSLKGRLRVLLEALQPQGPVDADESVHDFGSRRIGREAADVLIDAMVSGVFAGDPKRLSLPSAFPKMRTMEAEHGSLFKAMLARRRHGTGGGPAGPGGTLTSFRDGLDVLPRALVEKLGDAVRFDAPVRGLRREGTRWVLEMDGAEAVTCDHVVLAVPARVAARVVRGVDETLASLLGGAPTAGLAVVALAYRDADLAEAPDGFGFLVPRSEGLRMLGCLRDSTIFPGRAPEGRVLLRVMIGGAHDPEAVTLEDDHLLATVRSELELTLRVRAEPILARIFRHPAGIAQYDLGHQERLNALDRALERLPGLTLTGSSYRGVSMNSCIEDAERVADRVSASLIERLDIQTDHATELRTSA